MNSPNSVPLEIENEIKLNIFICDITNAVLPVSH